MKRLMLISILGMLLLLGSSSHVMAQDGQDQETFIVVFDESHYQYFTADMMSTALGSLNTSLDTPNLDVTISLLIQEDAFNATNIQGSDLVIVTNPGTDEDGVVADPASSEADALENLINIGGSVLWMSNPLAVNQNVTGHADPLNELIYREFGATVTTGTGDTDNTTVILDDFNFVNNNSYVELSGANINEDVLKTELNNITTDPLLYYGAHLTETSGLAGAISANTSGSAYVLNPTFTYREFQNSPRWLFGQSFDNDGRGMLIGSTVMFSDMAFDETTSWVEQGSNLALFQNIIAWLLELTPVQEANVVTEPFAFFVNFNITFGILLTLAVVAVVIFSYVYQGRLSLNQLTKIRNQAPKTRSKAKKATKTSKKTKKKASKRKRT